MVSSFRIVHPYPYGRASQVVLVVKNLPADEVGARDV